MLEQNEFRNISIHVFLPPLSLSFIFSKVVLAPLNSSFLLHLTPPREFQTNELSTYFRLSPILLPIFKNRSTPSAL